MAPAPGEADERICRVRRLRRPGAGRTRAQGRGQARRTRRGGDRARRDEKSSNQRGGLQALRQRPPDCGGRSFRPLRGRAVLPQGLDGVGRGRADERGQSAPCACRARLRRRNGQTLSQGGPDLRRQDKRSRVRPRADHRIGSPRAVSQSVGPDAHAGRLQRRVGGGGGGAPRADGARHRRRRLDPHSRLVLRPGRPQADARAHPARPHRGRGLARLLHRPRAHPFGARQRRPARRHAGRRRRRAVRDQAAGAPLSRRGRRRAGTIAHRLHHHAVARRLDSSRLRQGGRGDRGAARDARSRSRRSGAAVRARALACRVYEDHLRRGGRRPGGDRRHRRSASRLRPISRP